MNHAPITTAGLLLSLWGCAPPTVQLSGTIYASHALDSLPQEGAQLTVVDFDGEVLATAETNAQGRFSIELPEGTEIVAEIRGEGLATATFPGLSGLDPVAELADRTLFAVSLAEVEAERALFAGCPGAAEADSLLFGQMRLHGLVDPVTGENPVVSSGRVDVHSAAGEQWSSCYLDPEGSAHDPTSAWTGLSGRFAVFDLSAGLHEIDARYELLEDYWLGELYPVWIPEQEEVVAIPAWPVFVPFES